MGNQGKMERNSKVCVEFKTMKSIHDMQFCSFLFPKTEDMCSKVRQNKVGEAIVRITLLNKDSAIP